LSFHEFLAKVQSCASTAPYSTDLSPCDFFLFPKLKLKVKGYNFQRVDSVQKAVTDSIETLAEADFQSCYDAWKNCCAKRVVSEGCYFERDNVDLDK
jgi:hypothetical protein